MPNVVRPGTPGSGTTALDRLREAKRSADRERADGLRRLRLPGEEPAATEPAIESMAAPLRPPVVEPTATAARQLPDVPAHEVAAPAHVSSGPRRESLMQSVSGSGRFRAAIVAALVLVLFAGIGVVATTSSRGALAASEAAVTSTTPGVDALVNPAGVLNPPLAQKLVDGSAIEPIDSTPYKITLGGVDRYFRLHFPGGVAPRSARPLIVVLPGWRRTARDAEREYGFDQLSDTSGATIAYLDGAHNSWDAGTCCGFAAEQKLDDVGALHVIVDALANLVQVDRRHVILAGFSNGAMLAYRTACSQSNQLAGIIVASGSLQVGSCKPGPLALVVSHGERDTTLPIKGVAFSHYLDGPVTSMAASLAPFERADACKTTTSRRTGRYDITQLRGCAAGASVTTYVDSLGGHSWLGQVPAPGVVGGQSFAYTAWQLLGGRASVVPFSS